MLLPFTLCTMQLERKLQKPGTPFIFTSELIREVVRNTSLDNLLICLSIQKDERHSTKKVFWAVSPFADGRSGKLRIERHGKWFCCSSKKSGDILSLVQDVQRQKGIPLLREHAAHWLLESGASWLPVKEWLYEPEKPSPQKTKVNTQAQELKSIQSKPTLASKGLGR